jgi:hypothetical protein
LEADSSLPPSLPQCLYDYRLSNINYLSAVECMFDLADRDITHHNNFLSQTADVLNVDIT